MFGFFGGIVVVGGSGSGGFGVVVVVLLRRFGRNRFRRIRRNAVIFCACVRGGAGTLIGDGVGGTAGSDHGVLIVVCVGVLVGDGVGTVVGASHIGVVGVFSGVGEGGIAGSAHKDLTDSGVMALSSDGEGGIAGSAHRVVSSFGVEGGAVVALVAVGACSCSLSASIASAKNLSSPLDFLSALRWFRPLNRASGLC